MSIICVTIDALKEVSEMSNEVRGQIDRISELFSKMSEEQKAVFIAYGDGLLTASEMLAPGA